MSSSDTLSPDERTTLLDIARASIRQGLQTGRPLPVNPDDYDAALRDIRATFVTLHLDGRLRGCIGTLSAHRPLVTDIAHNAYAAAFNDPRFPPVSDTEADRLDIHLSVLSKPEPMHFDSEPALLAQLRPGIDGLILSDGRQRGTFLPSVWESLPTAREFLSQLKRKAGLPTDYWSDTLRVDRYTTESFP